MGYEKVIIDTDPGINDAAALLIALASPELSIVAITTVYGNVPIEVTTQNAYRVLHSANRTRCSHLCWSLKAFSMRPKPRMGFTCTWCRCLR